MLFGYRSFATLQLTLILGLLFLWQGIESTIFAAFVNFDDKAQDFVLETRRLHIPGYPDAFNPSIVRWKGSILLSFRIRDPRTLFTNKIGFVYLDEEFNLISEPTVLNIRNDFLIPSEEQDPRLITIGERLFIVYSNSIDEGAQSEIRRMHIAEVFTDQGVFYTGIPECLSEYEGAIRERREKNWAPFEYKGEILLSRTLFPHQVVQPFLGTGECKTIAITSGAIDWKWGELRGGTSALLEGNEYLAFFHSSKDMKTVHSQGKHHVHYFMGAYMFSADPPFALTRMSREPIFGRGFYRGPAYKTWKPLRVVFPCGFICKGQNIWVFYGKQDHEIWMVKIDKQGLFKSLIPVPLQ